MVDVTNSYKEINSIFSEAKSAFSAMAKPVKRDVEISAVEQDNIKNAVYQALNGIDEKNINDKNYQTAFSKVTDSAMKELEKTNIVNKEQKLDAFFNSGEIEMHTELDDNTLRNVLKEGKVVSTDKASSKAESPSDDSKTDNASAGVSRNDSLDGIHQKGQVSIEPIKSVESITNFDEDDIFSGSTPIVTENKLEASSSSDKIEKSTDIFKSQNTDDLYTDISPQNI